METVPWLSTVLFEDEGWTMETPPYRSIRVDFANGAPVSTVFGLGMVYF